MSETAPRFAGIGGHHSHRAGTVEWLTPPRIIAALGPFDLDPCAPEQQPYPTAVRTFTRRDNGLLQRWEGRVWLNPPYTNGEIGRWLARMADHDCGTALIFARTDTEAFHRHVFDQAAGLLFMEGRINFHLPDGTEASGNAGAPTVLCAYGLHDLDVLAASEIAGQLVPLRFPRSVLGAVLEEPTWRQVVDSFFAERDGPVDLADLYRYVRSHPKSAGNNHPEAKARQILQRGPYRPARRGAWERIVE